MSKHAVHAPVPKPLKLQMQTASKSVRKILLEANDAYAEYRRSGFKGSWWNHRRGNEDNAAN